MGSTPAIPTKHKEEDFQPVCAYNISIMTLLGHVAASYLLARSTQLFGYPISVPEIETCIVAGTVLDLDILAGLYLGKSGDKHHNLAIHTPAAVLAIVVTLALITKIHLALVILVALALLLHLALDDISYWFYKLKLQENSSHPQINWLYPFKKGSPESSWITGYGNVLKVYFTKAKANVLLEEILLLAAAAVFLISY